MHRTILFSIVVISFVVSLLVFLVAGISCEAMGGWVRGPHIGGAGLVVKSKSLRLRLGSESWASWGRQRLRTWYLPLIRSLFLGLVWESSGQVGPGWVEWLPWLVWLLPVGASRWGRLRQGLEQVQRGLVWGYLGLSGYQVLAQLLNLPSAGGGWALSCLVCLQKEPYVKVEQTETGQWQATLCGHFTLRVDPDHPFRLRMLLILLGLLQSNDDQRRSRRTRDGRTPFVRQEQLASWTHTRQEHISLWTRYWLQGDWANLLSLKTAEVLTPELVERIVSVFATFPHWSSEQVYQHLRQQKVAVSLGQVEQASRQSGWQQLQATLKERFDLQSGLRLRDEWLVTKLLQQVHTLVDKVEAGNGLTPEERLTLADLQALAVEAGAAIDPPLPAQPWLQSLEGLLLSNWEQASDPTVRCLYCGSSDVAPKSKQPRQKKFYAADGQLQTGPVYRYYCHNPQCSKKSFTHLPNGLQPHSPYRTQVHVLALQMYAWGYSNYRRTATALGVCSMTAYRWVSAWGHDLLPIAALFGAVKSSGIVGVDEKYVLVPKNDKPAGDMRRWMYVYLAVDLWTYDLLHIAIYPYNTDASAEAFLLALRAKGYSPQVIVTDLRQDYGPVIARVFKNAIHHECIFHALQNVHKHLKEAYGSEYATQHPEAELLRQQIADIFNETTPERAEARYRQVCSLREVYCQATPAAASVFDFLEHHWPKLVNAIGSAIIPTTNNVTELVIRRFDQHYQNFCGFESLESAQLYLGVFEKLYRFTPFSQDAQPRIRGKSPLQLAGYDISQLPMAAICSGSSIDWPTVVNLVPN